MTAVLTAPSRNVTFADVPPVVVLIPAHDEEATVLAAIAAVRAQTVPVARIVVVADRCTDRTVPLARSAGAEVFETSGNEHRKAGALNQALAAPGLLSPDCYVLVMDADSAISQDFVAVALAHLGDGVGAVGGVFYGDPGAGVLGQFQRNEYLRYAREIDRRRGRAAVLTGTATIFSFAVMRKVSESRGTVLPGRRGEVYNTDALTEDNELTLAIKHLGHRCLSPRQCRVSTEVMQTWRDLYRQRLRWQRGALEDLRRYGWTRVTVGYRWKQFAMYGLIPFFWLYLALTVASLLAGGDLALSPFWTAVGAVFLLERVVTVARGGWRGMALAATLLAESAYDVFQQFTYLSAAFTVLTNRKARW